MLSSDILITLAYSFALFFAPLVFYVLLIEDNKGGGSRYKTPDWYYVMKKFFAIPTINNLKKKSQKQQAALEEELQEQPRKLSSGKQTDTQVIHGLDQEGHAIFLKITLRQHRIAEIVLHLRLNNNKSYRLPNEPQVLLCSIPSRQWKAQGLALTITEPFRRLRITYNGLLRDVSAGSGKTEHVKFNFIWNAVDKPLHYPQDMPNSLFADALAREPWRDGNWIELMGVERGYEQYGALQGFVAGEAFPDDYTLYVPSFRKRQWGAAAASALHRDLSLFVVAEDGTLFSIGARSYKKGCAQLKYGSIIDNKGIVYPVDDHDISLEYIGENSIPDVITVHLTANKKTYKCILHVDLETCATTHSNAHDGWELKTVLAKCVLNSQQAKAQASFWYSKQGTGVDLPNPLLTEPKVDVPPNKFTAPFSAKECRVAAFAGGKGGSLALLSSLNSNDFAVPEGFVLLTGAFKHQLGQNVKLKRAVEGLEDACRRGKTEQELAAVCKATVDLFTSEPICQEVAGAILKELEELRNKPSRGAWRWAVRSSGSNEDSEELSAAGQNSTFLGCTTENDVLTSVAACWGSLFTFQSVQYRRQLGLEINCQMAVVVQRMVPAEAAGVLFTCHPTTGDPSKMVVTANYGLGESVVSGQADPDTAVLERTPEGHVSVLSNNIGSKKTCIRMSDDGGGSGGTVTSKVDADSTQKACLTTEQLLLLGKVGIELEKAHGSPRDVEWAFYQNNLYLLQSRPITTLTSWTDFELLHEFDMPVVTNQELMTISNIAEVMPGAMTALSSAIMNTIICRKMYRYIMQTKKDPFISKFTGTVNHHGVINVTNCFFLKVEDKITTAIKVLDMAIFGHPVTDEKLHAVAVARNGAMSTVDKVVVLLRAISEAFRNDAQAKRAAKLARSANLTSQTKSCAVDTFRAIQEAFEDFSVIYELHGRTTASSVFCQTIAMNVLANGSDDLTMDHYYDISILLSSCSNVVSAEIPKTLEKITHLIQESGVSEKFVKVKSSDGLNWLRLNCPKASNELNSFFDVHGHRGLREFEFKEDSWGMNPAIIIEMLQVNCKGKSIVTKAAEFVNVDDTVAKLVTPKSNNVRRFLKFLVKKCRTAVAKREETKSELIRMTNQVRLAFRELGKQMVLEGTIPDPQLIYHFSFYELTQVIRKRDPVLIRKALQRQRLHPQWDKLKLPELIYGFPKLEKDLKPIKRRLTGSDVVLKGTPACSEDITARACVITDLDNIDQLQAGDILITYSTDVGWSPYFPILSAVVTELGGLISHGAVVAREYGLPCIVGVENATAVFKTGDVVHISGKTGTLELITSADLNPEIN